MRFALTADHVAFRDAVRELLAKEPRDAPATWDALVDMGVTDLVSYDPVALAPVLEETGYAALAFPVVETAMRGATAMTAVADGDLVAWADRAAVVLDASGDPVDPSTLTPVATVDPLRPVARLAEPRARVLDDRLALGTAAQLVGLGQGMLDMTVAYVKEREQFGVPVGSFQAVKHHLANALKDLSFARPAVYRAAYSFATGATTVERDISMAKAMASDAASRTARVALQCHGAIGYTVEYDLHVLLKRTWALARAWGDASQHRDRVGTALGI